MTIGTFARLALVLAALLVASACETMYEVEAKIATQCKTPVPLFTADPAAPQDSVAIGCPYAYIDRTTGDTVVVVYTVP